MITALELLGAFVLIIAGAIGFTNAVEWLGQRMNLGAGAVGALLAAVGTALPESIIQTPLAVQVARILELTPHNHDPPWRLTPNLRGPHA